MAFDTDLFKSKRKVKPRPNPHKVTFEFLEPPIPLLEGSWQNQLISPGAYPEIRIQRGSRPNKPDTYSLFVTGFHETVQTIEVMSRVLGIAPEAIQVELLQNNIMIRLYNVNTTLPGREGSQQIFDDWQKIAKKAANYPLPITKIWKKIEADKQLRKSVPAVS